MVQDLATQWIQSYQCKQNFSGDGNESTKFLQAPEKPKVIYTDNTLEFVSKSCQDLAWNHRAKQNLHMRRRKFVRILGAVAQTESCNNSEPDRIWENHVKIWPNRKPEVIYTDNSLEFGKSCEVLSLNHSFSTPHRSETNGIAERAVRRVKKGTSAVLLQIRIG